MGMDFGDGPDMDKIKEERKALSIRKKVPEEKVLTEDDCWEHMIYIQMYKPTKTDNGIREILRNTLTKRFRKKKKVGEYQEDPHNNSVKIDIWDWDGEPYEKK